MTAADADGAEHVASEAKAEQSPMTASDANDVSELGGWQPYPPVAPVPRRRQEVPAGMTDEQILTHYRARDFDPYMTLGTARALYRLNLKFRHLRRAVAKVEQDAQEKQRARLQALVHAKAAARASAGGEVDSGSVPEQPHTR
jgi:hypothetical protein